MKKREKSPGINFLRGVPAEEALEHLVPLAAKGYRESIKHYGTDVLQYGHFTGFKPLREIIGNIHGVDPGRVIAGNGGMEIISLFLKSLPSGSTIAVEEATYDRVVLDAERYGHKVVGVKLSTEGVDPDHLLKVLTDHNVAAFYGIPFHQNPTGINYSEERRMAVEEICRKKSVFCVWDVCYRDLRYDGMQNHSIEIGENGPVITSSFTKTISPGTKCGYMIVPSDYVSHISRVVANTRINPNLPTQAFIAEFISSGGYSGFVRYLRDIYRPRMEALNAGLERYFPEIFPVKISGGFFAALSLSDVPASKESQFVELARDAGVGIVGAWDAIAPDFREDLRKKGLFIRLTFPSCDPGRIEWGIGRLRELSDTFRSG